MIGHMYDIDVINKAIKIRDSYPSQDKVRQYLEYGFILRAFQIRDAYWFLTGLSTDDTIINIRPLNRDEYSQANLYLSSFYYNIYGAIDNLTWLVKHNFKILNHIDETSKNKCQINFLKKDFLKDLDIKAGDLKEIIGNYEFFIDNIRSMRDLTAHRLPPHIAKGHLHDTDISDYNETVKAYNKLISISSDERSKMSMDELDAILDQSTIILKKIEEFKKFKPVVVRIDHSNPEEEIVLFYIKDEMDKNYQNFLNFSEAIFDKLMGA